MPGFDGGGEPPDYPRKPKYPATPGLEFTLPDPGPQWYPGKSTSYGGVPESPGSPSPSFGQGDELPDPSKAVPYDPTDEPPKPSDGDLPEQAGKGLPVESPFADTFGDPAYTEPNLDDAFSMLQATTPLGATGAWCRPFAIVTPPAKLAPGNVAAAFKVTMPCPQDRAALLLAQYVAGSLPTFSVQADWSIGCPCPKNRLISTPATTPTEAQSADWTVACACPTDELAKIGWYEAPVSDDVDSGVLFEGSMTIPWALPTKPW